MHSEPTIGVHSKCEVKADDSFGTYQGWQVQTDEPSPSRNGVNPIASQVEMGFHSDVFGTNLMTKKQSETMTMVTPRAEATKMLRVHLASVVRCCAKH